MRILYTVCGSISAYKAYDIVRGLINEGHQVRVLLTKGAVEFIKPQTFRYLGAENVYLPDDDFHFPKRPEDNNVLHVELARWCQKLVIAPATANTLAKLSMGMADDLLSSVFLAIEDYKPVIIFPAMNTQMLKHTLVQENMNVLERLKKVDQVRIMPTKAGELACGETGDGKLLEVEKIIDMIDATPVNKDLNDKKRVLITTGATISPLDSVRYLTNPSSGLTGLYLAKQALARGHQVTLLAGKYSDSKVFNLTGMPNFSLKKFTSTSHLKQLVREEIPRHDAYISPAAVGDLEFYIQTEKIKKNQLSETLEFKKAPDILKEVVENHSDKYIVGFAAETELTEQMLQTKWNSKPVNLLIGTKVSNGLENPDHSEGFQNESANYATYNKGKVEFFHDWTKKSMAVYVIEQMEKSYVD